MLQPVKVSLESLKHFDEKLLLLKDMMNTDKGKKIAERRHKYMIEFLKEFNNELEESR